MYDMNKMLASIGEVRCIINLLKKILNFMCTDVLFDSRILFVI